MSHARLDRQRCNSGWCAVRTLQTVWAFHEKCVFLCFLGFCVFVCCVCFCSWFLRRKAPLFFFFLFVCSLSFFSSHFHIFLVRLAQFPSSLSQAHFPASSATQNSTAVTSTSDPQATPKQASHTHHAATTTTSVLKRRPPRRFWSHSRTSCFRRQKQEVAVRALSALKATERFACEHLSCNSRWFSETFCQYPSVLASSPASFHAAGCRRT